MLFAGLLVTACTPEKFDGADINGIPSLEGIDFDLTIDASTNQMTAEVKNLPQGISTPMATVTMTAPTTPTCILRSSHSQECSTSVVPTTSCSASETATDSLLAAWRNRL